jgi:phosphatidylglycerophosphatase A
MSIKDSSEELNPPVVTADSIPTPKTKRSFKDYLALAIATCGVGYIPLAPGTWGSLVGVGVFYLLRYALAEVYWFALEKQWLAKLAEDTFSEAFDRLNLFFTAVLVLTIGAITLVGTWAASRTEKILRRKDPGTVVIDEVAGQLIAFVFLPAYSFGVLIPPIVIIGFVAFRVFDIIKPYPARRLESLPAGLGIMSDDIVAGMYAAAVIPIVAAIDKLWFILK